MNDGRAISPSGLVVGATIGLTSGLLLDYLTLLGLWLLRLPTPASSLQQLIECPWFLPVTLAGNVASGSFTIQRLAFGIGSGERADTSMVADEVQVRFKLQLAGLKN